MNDTISVDTAKIRVEKLITRFKRNEADYLRSNYNETQARTEFITPLLEAFGWDVGNTSEQPLAFREVIEEAYVEVGEEGFSKKPDYELRLARQRKIFVEAKKPSIKIDRDIYSVFQTRRYGYSASLPVSVLTNFHQLAIYDCRLIPKETDPPHTERVKLIHYEDYLNHFDELWSTLSREAVYSGDFDRMYDVDSTRRGAEQFDDYFLNQVCDWRERLAIDIHANTPKLTNEELTYAVQLFLSRIIFLRICEDRDIEEYETLKELDATEAFEELMKLLRRADKFYNSGLFALLDDERLGIRISDATLISIVQELYYPRSPYTFSVIETEVLGEIYDTFLCDVINVEDGVVKVVRKPEVRESAGVVPTPSFIAHEIVNRTLSPAIEGKSPKTLAEFTVADICCGSGIFLLSAYTYLLSHYLAWYMANDRAHHVGRRIYQVSNNQWRLTFSERRRILLAHLRGVDIDPNAVEVAQFSLLLKLIEDESQPTLKDFVTEHKQPALPPLDDTIRCGNSLVSTSEWISVYGSIPTDLFDKVNPINWEEEFPSEMMGGGFNVIIGNPPYIRIQKMVAYSPEEVSYYQSKDSPYTTAHKNNFDKYALFIERSLSLIRSNGRIGVIVPHKFMSIQAGYALRELLTVGHKVEEIVDFGVKRVFGQDIANYTCIININKAGAQQVRLERVGALEEWRYGHKRSVKTIRSDELDAEPWEFANEETQLLFARIRKKFLVRLENIAEILVGLQTSADDIYILTKTSSDADFVNYRWHKKQWQIESSILRPCLKDITLHAYAQPVANASIIFPYKLITNQTGKVRASLIQPSEMEKCYPECWDYLCSRREELESRNISGGSKDETQWYQFGRSQSLTKFDRPKIILPVLSKEPRYAYDEAGAMITGGGNGPYYMVRPRDDMEVSALYLLAILNHPLSEAFIRMRTSSFQGGYYSHGKEYIKNLPIPIPDEAKHDEIKAKTAELRAAMKQLEDARMERVRRHKQKLVNHLRDDLNETVSNLFSLTKTDKMIVEAVPIPS